MEIMERKKPRSRRSCAPEFMAEIVGHCGRGDRSIHLVAGDFDLTETAVRARVTQAHHHTEWSTSGDRNPGFMTLQHRAVPCHGE